MSEPVVTIVRTAPTAKVTAPVAEPVVTITRTSTSVSVKSR